MSGEAVQVYFGGGYVVEGLGVEAVFALQDAGGQGFGGVVGQNGDLGLGYDGAAVVFFVNEVDADAGDALAGGDDGGVDALAVHSASAEFGQKGGVDVQDAVAVSAECLRAEFLHVSGEGYELDAVSGEGIGYGLVEARGVGVGDGAEVGGGDVGAAGAFQREGAGVVGDDDADFGVEGAVGAGGNYGLEVGSAVGGEDA